MIRQRLGSNGWLYDELAPGDVVRVPLSYGGDATAADFDAARPGYIDLTVDAGGLTASATLSLTSVTGDGFEIQGDKRDILTGQHLTAAYGVSVRVREIDGYFFAYPDPKQET